MVSTPRNLIIASGIALASLLLTESAHSQTNYGRQQISSYSGSTQASNSTAVVDHSSMSPDSWSAPAVTNATVVDTNAGLPNTTRPTTGSAQFQPALSNTFAPRSAQSVSSPSIPDLTNVASRPATRPTTNQIRSLIRQPQIEPENSVSTGEPRYASRSTFQQAMQQLVGQDGLPLTSPTSSNPTNTSVPAFGNQSSLPQNIPSTTAVFDIDPASNPVGDDRAFSPQSLLAPPVTTSPVTTPPVTAPPVTALPEMTSPVISAPVARSPFTSPPAFSQPTFQTQPGRYPLGINGSLPTAALQEPARTAPLSYQALTAEPQAQLSVPANPQSIFQQQPLADSPIFRPDLGHRAPNPTFRGRDHDNGLKMDFEDKKKQYPGFREILATGRYFGSAELLFIQPGFQNNSAITQFNSPRDGFSFASSESFDFDYETAPQFRFGFESRFGPGLELEYFQFDQGSNISSFTANGLNRGELSAGTFGPSSLTTLEAVNAGETLSAIHSIDIETFSAMLFKEIKFPISRLNGMFGFQYASIFQELEGELTDAGGNVLGSLRSTSDLRAYGPKFRLEYYRPIGHTKLEFVTKFGGGVLFGERDQIISNTGSPAVNRFGADEYVVMSDYYGGVQYKQLTAENRAIFARLGFTYSSYVGGGTAVNAQDNFGLRGFAFAVGYNR